MKSQKYLNLRTGMEKEHGEIVEFKCSTKELYSNSTDKCGFYMSSNIYDYLSRALGFQYYAVPTTDTQGGHRKVDGNWTGLMGMFQRGEIDIMDGIVLDYERTEVIQFSTPYAFDTITFASDIPKVLPKAKALTYPFESVMWVFLLTCLFWMPLVLRFLLQKRVKLQQLYLKIFGNILRQGNFNAETISDRLAFGSWLIASTVISMAYVAVLLSSLTVPFREPPIDNIRDLSRAVSRGEVEVWARRDHFIGKFLCRSNIEEVRNICDHIENNNWYFNSNEEQNLLSKSKTAIFLIKKWHFIAYPVEFTTHKIMASDYFYPIFVGLGFKKGFCCVEEVNIVVQRYLAAGLFQKDWNDFAFVKRLLSKFPVLPDHPYKPLSFSDLSGAFICLLIGYALSFSVFLFELILKKCSST